MADASASQARRSSRLFEWLVLGAGVVLVGAGLFTYVVHPQPGASHSNGLTRQIMPGLDPADRIEAAGNLAGYNVLIITTDTTRADHVGCYGNRGVQTPVIDGLARDGILFSQAVTPTPSTLPAHTSLLTGLLPHNHRVRANGTYKVEDNVTTLAERLKGQGYRTGAVVSAYVLDSRFGLDQGFDFYDDDLTKGMKYSPHMFRERAAELANEPAIRWLRERSDAPFFLWIHYFDPHAVYMPPEPYRTKYKDDLYDGEIAYADAQIGVLLKELEDLGVRDKTLVVFASDHGEGFGEHGEQTHSLLIYDATLHVPLIISAPSALPRGKLIGRQASLIDVTPTVLSLLGMDAPEDLDGFDWTQPPPAGPRGVVIESISPMTLHGWAPLIGLRRDDYKFIQAPTPELYDLAKDPRELKNIHDKRAETVRELRRELTRALGGDPYTAALEAGNSASGNLDSEAMARLAALGYLHTAPARPGATEELRDPKEMIGHWEKVQRGVHLGIQGRPKEGIAILEDCLKDAPRDVYARRTLASAYRQMGDLDQAMKHLEVVEKLEPNSSSTHLAIAGIHLARREYGDFEDRIEAALLLEPDSAQAWLMKGTAAMQQGNDDEALAQYRRAIAMDPGSTGPAAYNQIGSLHLRDGRLEEAREAFQKAIEIDSLNGAARSGLASILIEEDQINEAKKELALALRFDPNQPNALATLGALLSREGNQEQALRACERALELAPKQAQSLNITGLVNRRLDRLDKAEEYYLQAIERSPRFVAAHVNLAQLYLRQERTEEAMEQFRKAVAASPRRPNPIALVNLGAHHFNQGEPAKALAMYRRALRMKPDYALAHQNIAAIYALKEWDRPDLTVLHLRRSLELAPEDANAPQLRQLLARAEQEAARRGMKIPEAPSPEPAEE